MKINVTIERSSQWIQSQQLVRAENVTSRIVVSVEVSELSPEVRSKLLAWKGEYQDITYINFDRDFEPSRYGANYGRVGFLLDSDAPTESEINAAIATAFAELDQKRAEYLAAKQEREEREAAEKAEKAEKAQRLAEARTLLADELLKLTTERDKLKSQRSTLSELLAAVPLDAIRGTIKRLVSADSEIEAKQTLIEDASDEWIFSNRDDDDNE